jgi:alanyl-tRNA synthetase
VAEVLGEAFPEIARRQEHIQLLVKSEEEAFAKTLGRGLVRFEELAGRVRESGATELPGAEAYELYATFGFPRDLVELMAREREMQVDGAGWEKAQLAHVEASRAGGKFRMALAPEQLAGLEPTVSAVHEEAAAGEGVETRIAAHFPFEEQSDVLVLEKSPFYAEAGGQIGDQGLIEAPDGSFRFRVDDTQLMGEIVLHHGEREGVASEGMPVRAVVDRDRRERTRRHHTATHLLHAALREVLGEHVTQQGSYVGPDRLRFDLSHPRAIRADELERIEARVNEEVCANHEVKTAVEELEAARARGAMALFGEKYADRVRVVEVEGTSVELCGGTHVCATGDIGPFVIVSEGAIQAGVRRVEALAGPEALSWIQERRRLLRETAQKLKSSPEELPERVDQLLSQVKQARKKASSSSQAEVDKVLEEVRGGLVERDGLVLGAFASELDQKGLRELATRVKSLAADLAVVLLGSQGEKVPWIAICQGAALERGLDARTAAGEVARHVGGGGGGRPELAQGQGSKAAGRRSLIEQHGEAPEGLFQAAASIDTAQEQG